MEEVTTQIKNQKKTKDYHLTNNTYNIVLDHQPQGTRENVKNNIDLQLSDHTHNGQMFPLSYSYHLQPDFAGNYGKETFKHYKFRPCWLGFSNKNRGYM